MGRIAEVVTASEKALGIFVANPAEGVAWRERGARYLITGLEPLLSGAMHHYLETVRGTEGVPT